MNKETTDELTKRAESAEATCAEMRAAILKRAPVIGAWENRCSFCHAFTECGEIEHENGCILTKLESIGTGWLSPDETAKLREDRDKLNFELGRVIPSNAAMLETLKDIRDNPRVSAIIGRYAPGALEMIHRIISIEETPSAAACSEAKEPSETEMEREGLGADELIGGNS